MNTRPPSNRRETPASPRRGPFCSTRPLLWTMALQFQHRENHRSLEHPSVDMGVGGAGRGPLKVSFLSLHFPPWHTSLACACVLSWPVMSSYLQPLGQQAPPSMGFFRQEYWSGLPCPPPGDLPHREIEPVSLTSPALAGRFFTTSAPGTLSWSILQLGLCTQPVSIARTATPSSSPGGTWASRRGTWTVSDSEVWVFEVFLRCPTQSPFSKVMNTAPGTSPTGQRRALWLLEKGSEIRYPR